MMVILTQKVNWKMKLVVWPISVSHCSSVFLASFLGLPPSTQILRMTFDPQVEMRRESPEDLITRGTS